MKLKKLFSVILITALLCTGISPVYASTEPLFSENFDSYTAGITESALSANWTRFGRGNTSGAPAFDAYIGSADRDGGLAMYIVNSSGMHSNSYAQLQSSTEDNEPTIQNAAVLSADVMLADKLTASTLSFRADTGSVTECKAFTFNTNGTVTVGETAIPSATFSYQTNRWYNVKVYYLMSAGRLKADITSGTSKWTLYGTTSKIMAHVNRMQLQKAKNTSATNSYVYFDNCTLDACDASDYDLFYSNYNYDFDDLTEGAILSDGTTGYADTTYNGWYIGKNWASTWTCEANPYTDGQRKGVELVFDATGGAQYYLTKPVNFTITDDTVIEMDVKVTPGFRFYINDTQFLYYTGTGYLTNAGGSIIGSGLNASAHYRCTLTFDMTANTYDISVVNLSNNGSVTDACKDQSLVKNVALPSGFNSAISKIKFGAYVSSGETRYVYIDSIRITEKNHFRATTVSDVTEDIIPSEGINVVFNNNINIANNFTGNVVTVNGQSVPFTTDGKNTLSITQLPYGTDSTLAYTVYDMSGTSCSGTLDFTTVPEYSFGEISVSGGVASVNGVVYSDDAVIKLYIAVYNSNGELTGINVAEVRGKELKDHTSSLAGYNAQPGDTVRAFLWTNDFYPIKWTN